MANFKNGLKTEKNPDRPARIADSRAYGENDLFHFLSHFDRLTAAWPIKEEQR